MGTPSSFKVWLTAGVGPWTTRRYLRLRCLELAQKAMTESTDEELALAERYYVWVNEPAPGYEGREVSET